MIIPFPSGSDLWSYHSHPKATPDQTILIRKRPLIILFPYGSDLWSYHPQTESDPWSDHSHPELTSDQTIPIRNWPLIRPFSSESDPWSDYSHPEPKPRPCNYGLGTHRVRWTSDDQRSLPDGTSTWEQLNHPFMLKKSPEKTQLVFGWKLTECRNIEAHPPQSVGDNRWCGPLFFS